MMRKFVFLCIIFPFTILAQTLLLEENFNYTENTNLTNYGWVAHSGAGNLPIQVVALGLSYPNYPPSNQGNAAALTGTTSSAEDVNKNFSEQNSGSVYAAFMVEITSAATTGTYFIHLGPTSLTTIFRGRIFVENDGSENLAFGVSKSSTSTISYTPYQYSLNTVYLIVFKYTFNPGAADDELFLWINPDFSGSEPSALVSQTDGGSDAENLGTVALRQGIPTSGIPSPGLIIDGIRISTSWESLFSGAAMNPPVISNITQTPQIPESTDMVTITADVTDDGTVNEVKLFYSVDSAPFDSTNMTLTSGDT